MKSGKLRHLLEHQQVTRTDDGQGGFTESWSTVFKPWAEVEPLNSREQFFANQTRSGTSHRVTTRYDSRIVPQDRFLFGTRVLKIVGRENTDERNRELVFICEEVG